MNHIEGRFPPDRIADHAGINIELAGERIDEGVYVRQIDFGDEVHVLGGAGNPVERAGERTSDQVHDSEAVERSSEPGDDEKRLGKHQ